MARSTSKASQSIVGFILALSLTSSVNAGDCDQTWLKKHWRVRNVPDCQCAPDGLDHSMPTATGFKLVAYCVAPSSPVYFFSGQLEIDGNIIVYKEADWDSSFSPADEGPADPTYKNALAHGMLGFSTMSRFRKPKMNAAHVCLMAKARIRITKLSFTPDDGRKPDTFIDDFSLLHRGPYQKCDFL